MPVEKFTVEQGDKTQEVFVAMTEEEAQDRQFTEYMREAQTEKVQDALRKKPPKESPKHSKEDIAGALKEYNEYRHRKEKSVNRKYF